MSDAKRIWQRHQIEQYQVPQQWLTQSAAKEMHRKKILNYLQNLTQPSKQGCSKRRVVLSNFGNQVVKTNQLQNTSKSGEFPLRRKHLLMKMRNWKSRLREDEKWQERVRVELLQTNKAIERLKLELRD